MIGGSAITVINAAMRSGSPITPEGLLLGAVFAVVIILLIWKLNP